MKPLISGILTALILYLNIESIGTSAFMPTFILFGVIGVVFVISLVRYLQKDEQA